MACRCRTRARVRRNLPNRCSGRSLVRVLGVDPGLTRCGLGVVEGEPGRPLKALGSGVARTPADADIAARLLDLEVQITSWIATYEPELVAVERVFSQHN